MPMHEWSPPHRCEDIAWIAWLALLISTPYYLVNEIQGPALSPVYTFVSLGLLAGCLLQWVLLRHGTHHSHWRRYVCIAGLVLALSVVVPEWLLLGRYVVERSAHARELLYDATLRGFLHDYGSLVIGISALACGFCSPSHGLLTTDRELRLDGSETEGSAASVTTLLVGYLIRLAWFAAYPPHQPIPGEPGVEMRARREFWLSLLPLFLFLTTVALLSAYCKRRRTSLNPPLLASRLALGMLGWSLLTRVIPIYREPVLTALFAFPIALLGLVLSPPSVKPELEGDQKQRNTPSSDRLLALPLTNREREVVDAVLRGYSTAEAAALLGIKPATVRVMLGNAYKKAGVSGLTELREHYSTATEHDGEKDGGASNGFVGPFDALAATATLALPIVLLPQFATRSGWGIGRQLVLGVGFSLFAIGALTVLGGTDGTKFAERTGRRLFRATLLATAGLGTMAGVIRVIWWGSSLPTDQAMLFGSSAIFCATLSHAPGPALLETYEQLASTDGTSKERIACSLVIAAAFAAILSKVVWLIAVPALLAITVTRVVRGSRQTVAKDKRPVAHAKSWGLKLALIYVLFMLGTAWEEAWRTSSGLSIVLPLLPFLVCCAAMALHLATNGDRRFWIAASVTITLALFAAHVHNAITLVLALAALCVLISAVSTRDRLLPLISPGWIALFFGMGTLSSFILVTRIGDYLVMNDYYTQLFGGRQNFLILSYSVASALSVAGIIACVTVHNRLRDRIAADAPHTDETRLRGYLVSRGCNETETNTLLLIAQGRTTSQIAAELHYAEGTINSARRTGYAKLAVSSRAALVTRFSQVTNS